MSDTFTPLAVKTRQAGDIVAGLVGLAGERLAIAADGAITEINSAAIKTAVESLALFDFSTSAGQASALVELQAIKGYVDNVEAQLAGIQETTALLGTEGTLFAIKDLVAQLDTVLDSILDAQSSLATEATLVEIKDRLDQPFDVATSFSAADGAAAPSHAAVVAGVDSAGMVQALRLDDQGRLIVAQGTPAAFKSSGLLYSDIAAGASATLDTEAVLLDATLERVVISSAAPLRAEIQVWDPATSMVSWTEAVLFIKAGETFQYDLEGGVVAEAGKKFRVILKNMDSEVTTRAYTTVHWRE